MKFKAFVCNLGMKLKKHSPVILTVGGVVGLTAAGVVACVQTTKAHAIVEDHKERLEEAHKAKAIAESNTTVDYTIADYRKDLVRVYGKTTWEFAKLYAVPFALAGLSITAILTGHNILSKRHAALSAAYQSLSTAFTEYRKAVRDEVGEEKENKIRCKATRNMQTLEKEKKDGSSVDAYKGRKLSPYAVFFDEASSMWTEDPLTNKNWVIAQQNWANELLKSRCHVFLNEIYRSLGLPDTPAGAIVGWVLSDDGSTDNYIDFGLGRDDIGVRNFINGEDPSVLLDFNVDGVVYDRI